MCLHRSRGQRMLIVPLSPLRQMTAGTNFVLVCASPAKTTLHNCRTPCTSRLAQAHKRAWPRGDLGCAGRRRAACTCSVTRWAQGGSVFATGGLIPGCTRMHASLGEREERERATITSWNSLRAPEQPRVDEEERTTKQHTNCTKVTPRERSKPKMNWQSQKRLLRRERLGCGVHQRECIVCVVALVRGEGRVARTR